MLVVQGDGRLASMSGYSDALLGALGSSAPLHAFLPRLLETYPASDTAEAERKLFEALAPR
jgi:hypothetical protein